MPNHITNQLAIIGQNPEKVLDAVEGKDEEGETLFDFNKIAPMPKSLHCDCGSGGDGAYDLLYGDWRKEVNLWKSWDKQKSISNNYPITRKHAIRYAKEKYADRYDWKLGKLYKSNEQTYGHRTWYSWAIENWGTKWNAYSIDLLPPNVIRFDTAWSTPEPIIKALSKMFPDYKFEIEWADEDTGYNVGRAVFENGKIISVYQPKGGSKEAYELCFSINPISADYFELVGDNYQYKEE